MNWGRTYLMCPPEHFGVLYEINPWMHREVTARRMGALATGLESTDWPQNLWPAST